MNLKPAKNIKKEKKEELIKIIWKLLKNWFSQIEIWELLWKHKNIISWLWVRKTDYPMSLANLEPLLEIAKEVLKKYEK